MSGDDEIAKLRKELKAEIEELKKQLAENRTGDEQRHKEIKELQKQQHQDNLRWKKLEVAGAFSTPITVILGLVGYYYQNKKDKGSSKEKEPKNNGQKISDLKEMVEVIKQIRSI